MSKLDFFRYSCFPINILILKTVITLDRFKYIKQYDINIILFSFKIIWVFKLLLLILNSSNNKNHTSLRNSMQCDKQAQVKRRFFKIENSSFLKVVNIDLDTKYKQKLVIVNTIYIHTHGRQVIHYHYIWKSRLSCKITVSNINNSLSNHI